MDEELREAIAEVRAWAAREGGSMDDMTDDEVLNGIRAAAASVPLTTVEIARAHGLKRLARALARYTSVPGDSAQ